MMRQGRRVAESQDSGIPGFRGMAKAVLRDSRGTVLMESILVLPLLLMLITGIFQFSRFWQARLLTRYAAYNAARAALVYNPLHYRIPADDGGPNAGQFKSNEGVCWLAAVTTLSWLSSTPDSDNFWMPGYGSVPHSSQIRSQVRLVPSGCKENNGWVKVTVAFRFPTLFPVFNAKTVFPDDGTADGGAAGSIEQLTDVSKHPHFTFVESCLLPKPWTTERYPHIDLEEQQLIASHAGGGT